MCGLVARRADASLQGWYLDQEVIEVARDSPAPKVSVFPRSNNGDCPQFCRGTSEKGT